MKYLKWLLYISAVLFSIHGHAAKSHGPVYVKAVTNEIDQGDAKDILDADKTALVYKCNELGADNGKLVNVSGSNTYAKGEQAGAVKSKTTIRKSVKSGETWFLCKPQRLDTVTDGLKARS